MVQLTKEGFEKLKEELRKLEEEERPKIAKKLEEAIAEGDLSENAAYEEAKDQQVQMEGRINEIKQIMATAEIVEKSAGGIVGVGSEIKVKMPDGTEKEFKVMGAGESNPAEGKISYDSPLGKAFIGHKKGDTAKAQTPAGEKSYKILDVK